MKLPHAAQATVAREKIEQYLLNRDHPDGGAKARFFLRHGYTLGDCERLARDLVWHGQTYEIATTHPGYNGGTSYSVVGGLTMPDGTRFRILTAWYIAKEDNIPRLSSAYPDD